MKEGIIKREGQNGKYTYLGIIRIEVAQHQWNTWKQKINHDTQYNKINQQKYSTIKKYLIPKRICEIRKKQNTLYTWLSEYELIVTFKNQDQEMEIEQINTFHKIRIDGSIQHDIQQLQDNSVIQLCNPLPIQQKKQKQSAYSWNYQPLEMKQYITVQVWISQGFLHRCNDDYHQNKKERNQMVRNKGYFQLQKSRLSHVLKMIQHFSYIIKQIHKKTNGVDDKDQKEYRQQQQQRNLTERVKRNFSTNKMREQQSPVNSQDIENMKDILDSGKESDDKKSKQISYNFTMEGDAGLYFDLSLIDFQLTPSPKGFIGQLKLYQRKALTWMLFREGAIHDDKLANISLDTPYWIDIRNKLGLDFHLLYNQDLKALVSHQIIEKQCKGGILADQMGLGKTIMLISLILAHRPGHHQPKQTLVIAPLSVLDQWKQKIHQFSPSLKVLVFHGQVKGKIKKISDYDVIITSQSVIRHHKIKADRQVFEQQVTLTDVQWFRVIIDEAHNFRNAKTKMAAAIYSLKAQYRWCLSGTPTQNSIKDIFSLIKFLKIFPWENQQYWQKIFPKKQSNIQAGHFSKLKQILKGIMIRRKKNSKDFEGNSLLDLPKLDIKICQVQMSKKARKIYRQLNGKADKRLSQLEGLQQQVKDTESVLTGIDKKIVNKRKRRLYNSILGLLMKMRMICCHQVLNGYCSDFVSHKSFIKQYNTFFGKKKIRRYPKVNFFEYEVNKPEFKKWAMKKTINLDKVYDNWKETLEKIRKGFKRNCYICNDKPPKLIFTPCLHFFCFQCISQALSQQKQAQQREALTFREGLGIKQKYKSEKLIEFVGQCPQCQQQLKLSQVFNVPRQNQFGINLTKFQPNQKIEFLMGYILDMKDDDKAIIYTSFLGMIKLVEQAMQKIKIDFLSLQGSDNMERRSWIIQQFSNNPRVRVLIITLKIGSVGLNLQAANKVFLMDPWWNPAVQQQAIARAHRFGQEKEIEAVKFVTRGSIEARIVKRSHQKKNMIDSILDIDDVYDNKIYSLNRAQIQYLLQMDEDEADGSQDDENNQSPQNKNTQNYFDDVNDEQMFGGNIKNQKKQVFQIPEQMDEEQIGNYKEIDLLKFKSMNFSKKGQFMEEIEEQDSSRSQAIKDQKNQMKEQ